MLTWHATGQDEPGLLSYDPSITLTPATEQDEPGPRGEGSPKEGGLVTAEPLAVPLPKLFEGGISLHADPGAEFVEPATAHRAGILNGFLFNSHR